MNGFAKCSCEICKGHIEFESKYSGETTTCPHCGTQTKLLLLQPQSLSVEIKRGVSPLGIAALVLGIIACAFCWIPFLGLISLPIAFIGLLLAGLGVIMSKLNKKTGYVFSISAGIVCLLSMFVAIAITGGMSALIDKLKEEKTANDKQPVIESEKVLLARKQVEQTRADYQAFVSNQSFETNSEYATIQSEADKQAEQVLALRIAEKESRQIYLKAQSKQYYPTNPAEKSRWQTALSALKVKYETIGKQVHDEDAKLKKLNNQLRDMKNGILAQEHIKIEAAESGLAAAKLESKH